MPQRADKILPLGFSMAHLIHRRGSTIRRLGSAFWAASFLFFLLYSAPHQVHHVFEQLSHAHHYDADHDRSTGNRDNRSSSDANCVFQVSASRCHLGLAWHVAPALLPVLIGALTDFHTTAGESTNFAAVFHIRAPPLA